jgi:hypothetical protein
MTDSGQRWYNHPVVNGLSLIFGVGGILLGAIFYIESRAYREPYYYLEPERTILVNRELAIGGKLTVSYAGYASPAGDITAVQCYFWNAGASPIHGQDILQPIKLVLGPGTQILDAAIIRESRPEIVQFRVAPDLTSDGKPTNSASISFRILEKSDGATLQVVYAGGPKASVLFTGVIEGANINPMKRAMAEASSTDSWARRFFGVLGVVVLVGAFALGATIPVLMVIEAVKSSPSPRAALTALRSYRIGRILAIEICLLIFIFGDYYFIMIPHPAVPSILLNR